MKNFQDLSNLKNKYFNDRNVIPHLLILVQGVCEAKGYTGIFHHQHELTFFHHNFKDLLKKVAILTRLHNCLKLEQVQKLGWNPLFTPMALPGLGSLRILFKRVPQYFHSLVSLQISSLVKFDAFDCLYLFSDLVLTEHHMGLVAVIVEGRLKLLTHTILKWNLSPN